MVVATVAWLAVLLVSPSIIDMQWNASIRKSNGVSVWMMDGRVLDATTVAIRQGADVLWNGRVYPTMAYGVAMVALLVFWFASLPSPARRP